MHVKFRRRGHSYPAAALREKDLEPKGFTLLKHRHLQRPPFVGRAAAKGTGQSRPP